jgi:phosphoribosyl-AMP cyclohydrolase
MTKYSDPDPTITPRWNADGLIPVIAQEQSSGEVLMMAWMNAEALALTLAERRAVYWSRSRQALWRKGDSSGDVQHLVSLHLDCDGDTLLMKVNQQGRGACHTGRRHCFLYDQAEGGWHLHEEQDHE